MTRVLALGLTPVFNILFSSIVRASLCRRCRVYQVRRLLVIVQFDIYICTAFFVGVALVFFIMFAFSFALILFLLIYIIYIYIKPVLSFFSISSLPFVASSVACPFTQRRARFILAVGRPLL